MKARIWLSTVALVVAACGHPSPSTVDGTLESDASVDAPADAPIVAPPTHLAVGNDRACAIHPDGTLWCWGGLAMSGRPAPPTVPAQIGTDATWTAISIGTFAQCGVDAGALYCWGYAGYGNLGTGATSPDAPDPVQIGTATDWTAVAAGEYHTCGIRGGALYCWGTSTLGEAGTAGTVVLAPTQIETATDWGAVAAGYQITCGLRGTGTLWCFGNSEDGRTGLGTTAATAIPTQVGTQADWTAVSVYQEKSCGRRADGTAWCWGQGYGTTPAQLGTDTTWTAIAVGESFRCGIDAGALQCAGFANAFGIGDGTQVDRASFVPVGAAHAWRAVAVGTGTACAIDSLGAAWCWGGNHTGALGVGTAATHATLARVGAATDWTQVAMNDFNRQACGIAGGALYCWGEGRYLGQGDGTTVAYQVPHLVGTGFADVHLGTSAGCARKLDGTLWCWGARSAIGIGTTSQYTAVQIGTATDWSAVAVDYDVCGIRGGALYCWGPNSYGEDGDGTTTPHETPLQVGTATDWTAVATYQGTSCGVRAGQLYCWGSSIGTPTAFGPSSPAWTSVEFPSTSPCGQRADQTYACMYPPSQTVYTDDSTALQRSRSCTIHLDHTLWCSGVQVGAATWQFVVATIVDRCAIDTAGALWCAGDGRDGELGLGDAWSLVPVAVTP